MRQPRTSWDQYSAEVDAENERQKETLRAFWKRERERRYKPGMFLTRKELLWFFAKVLFWSAVIAAFVIGWLAL